THENAAVHCTPRLVDLLAQAIVEEGMPARRLPSAAGHDAMAMTDLTDIGMLFLRCKGGVSHHPAESVREEDVAVALHVLLRAVDRFAPRTRLDRV
ncbi:MAG TPA: M20/M25/M40 family metallo-hydrolase, partial [Candidatus Baltobacteraceae bacterium]